MNVQDVFNKVINAGVENPNRMLFAMQVAFMDGAITREGYELAAKELHWYMSNSPEATLSLALEANGHPHSDADCLAVYSNWINRPSLKRQPRKVF